MLAMTALLVFFSFSPATLGGKHSRQEGRHLLSFLTNFEVDATSLLGPSSALP